ncbi:MAG TPA: S9 family peptidase [Blastocatellia bacterium]|nr:S9 family peptidase [Blastocatellia bacterium]
MRHRIASLISLLIALLVCATASYAQTKSGGLSAMDVFNLEAAGDPQISPDGTRVVYVRQFADLMSDRRCSNLWIINFDGTNNRPLTTGNYGDSQPRWSSDGTRIIYVSDRDGTPQIYCRWMDTGQTARITNLQSPPSGIGWSPDGKWVSFTSLVPSAGPHVGPLPSAPPGAKWADPPVVVDKLVYRFNGAGYLKPGFYHVFVVSSEGGTPRQITNGDIPHGGPGLRASDAVWTPDSKYLLVSTNRRPDYEYEPLDSEVYEFSVADGTVRALTDRRGPDGSPTVSPDGKLIAYTGFDDKYQGYQITRLYVMNRDGSGSHLISGSFDRDVGSPQWAPDGSGIYFVYDDQGDTKLGFYSLDGAMKTLARNIGSGFSAYGAGASVSIARGGNFATTTSRTDLPGDIAVGSISNPSLKAITSVNADLFASRKLGAVEEIWYTSSIDGRKVEGWIIKPPDFDPSKKYPLILEIHGGPFADYGDRFDFEKQVMAARGYVVLYTNPRGSTSYGGEFGNLIHHKYPGDDFYDLNSGVDAVISKGYIDTDNLYVTGGSGGGVLTCWTIGHTTRFRAAVPVYPVINWYSFNLTADISAFVTKYWFPGMPWDNVEHYEKRSLLSVVKNVKTPTMVMTGEEDYRTPISESEQYYTALKLLKIETVLVRVPGEPHGISRRPSHHAEKISLILNWFDLHRATRGAAGR